MLAKAFLCFSLALVAIPAHAAERCMQAVRVLSAGTVPAAGDFTAVDCGDTKPGLAVRYDAGMRAVRLVRALQPGDVVADIPASMMATISPGEKLYVGVQVGPVVVQREVEALQPANPGQRLFVRAADGQVMSVLYAEEKP